MSLVAGSGPGTGSEDLFFRDLPPYRPAPGAWWAGSERPRRGPDRKEPPLTPNPEAGIHPSASEVVVGVDGSEESAAALRWAARQADLTGATLLLVTAWEIPALAYGSFMAIPPDQFSFSDAADALLAAAVTDFRTEHPDLKVATRVVQGPPALALLHASEGADLLVVGSRGHGAFAGMLLGSVSAHCVSHSSCPVVVVRRDPVPTVARSGAAIPLSAGRGSALPVA